MMSASTRAVVTAGACVLLAGAVVFSPNSYLPAALVAIAIVIFAVGWPRLLAIPTQHSASVVIAATGIAGVITAITVQRMVLIALVVAGGIIAAFIAQMARKDGRPRLVESLAATVTGVAVASAASGWVALLGRDEQPNAGEFPSPLAVTVLAACALAISSLAVAMIPERFALGAAIITPGILGGILAAIFPSIHPVAGILLGLALGILVGALDQLFAHFPASTRLRPALAAALLPLLGAGIAIYTVARVIATLEL
ncbi:MAG: hypothetical protein Q4Q03_01890 [Bowdeniella nasicola]|nr:hypothetical protein [Bowdeniella nasicola]